MFIKEFVDIKFLKFLFVGGTCALLNYGSGELVRRYFGLFMLSIIIGYVIGTIASFILNKIITFKSYDEKISLQLFKFIIVAVSSLILAAIIAYLAKSAILSSGIIYLPEKHADSAAHLTTIVFTTLYNFLLMKHFAFKKLMVRT